jgi:hypothetical protein
MINEDIYNTFQCFICWLKHIIMALNYIFKTCTHISNKYARFLIIIHKKMNIYYKQAIPFSENKLVVSLSCRLWIARDTKVWIKNKKKISDTWRKNSVLFCVIGTSAETKMFTMVLHKVKCVLLLSKLNDVTYIQCECIQVALWSKMCPTAGFIAWTQSLEKGMLKHHTGICSPSRSSDTVNIAQIQRPDIQVNLCNDYHAMTWTPFYMSTERVGIVRSVKIGYRLHGQEIRVWFLAKGSWFFFSP